VALSRLRRLSDLLIFADFDPQPLTHQKPGIENVLKEIQANQTYYVRECSRCKEDVYEEDYAPNQFRRGDGVRVCLPCGKRAQSDAGATVGAANLDLHRILRNYQPKRCAECRMDRSKADYSNWELNQGDSRVCLQCLDNTSKRKCGRCGITKSKVDFTDWELHQGDDRVCKGCLTERRGLLTERRRPKCAQCGVTKDKPDFTDWELCQGDDRICKAKLEDSFPKHFRSHYG